MPRPTLRPRSLLPEPGPVRALAYSTLARTVGRGLFVTSSVVYFTKVVGLSPVQVGTGLTIAAGIALFAGVPMGHLADRIGPRTMTVAFGLASAVFLASFLLVDGWIAFVVIATLASVGQAAGGAASNALIAGCVPRETRVRTLAYLRAVNNVGWTVGAPLAGIALWLDTDAAYTTVILATGAFTALGALLTLRVPAVSGPSAARRERISAAVRDRPYVALTVLNALLSIHYGISNIAVPMWVLERTEAPAWMVSVLLVTNTLMVIALQVRASRGSGTVSGAARAQLLAGFLLAASCVLYALAEGRAAWIAAAVLVAGAAVHAFGELFQASGGWGLSFALAPDHAQGQYQGLYNTGFQLAGIVAPAVLAVAVVGLGWPGWIAMGACFAAAGLAVPAVARWAERTRPPAPEAAPVSAAATP